MNAAGPADEAREGLLEEGGRSLPDSRFTLDKHEKQAAPVGSAGEDGTFDVRLSEFNRKLCPSPCSMSMALGKSPNHPVPR